MLTESEISIVNTLLFGKSNSKNSFNKTMLSASIEFILSTELFNNSLLILIKKYTLSFFFHFFTSNI